MTRRRTPIDPAIQDRLNRLFENGTIAPPPNVHGINPETGQRHLPGRVLLIPPRCTAEIPEDFQTNPRYVAEPKPDGSRYIFYVGVNIDPYGAQPLNGLLSKYEGVGERYVDRTGNVPQITHVRYAPELQGTIFDGEIIGKDFHTTQRMMGSSSSECIRKQQTLGALHYVVWDVPYYCGRDVRHLPYHERRKLLVQAVNKLASPYVHAVAQIPHNEIESRFYQIVRSGGEGVVIKDINAPYGVSWAKMKKVYDVSVIVTGVTQGRGGFSDGIGSLVFSVLKDGCLHEMGKCYGFTRADRIRIGDNPADYIGKVIDIFVQEMAVKRVRHATFHRFRDDVNPAECTWKKFMDDLKPEKAKWARLKVRRSRNG